MILDCTHARNEMFVKRVLQPYGLTDYREAHTILGGRTSISKIIRNICRIRDMKHTSRTSRALMRRKRLPEYPVGGRGSRAITARATREAIFVQLSDGQCMDPSEIVYRQYQTII